MRGPDAPKGGPNATLASSAVPSVNGRRKSSGSPGPMVRAVALYALQRGLSPDAISEATGLAEKVWRGRFGRRPDEAMPALFNLLFAHEPDVAHTLLLGAEVPLAALGPLPVATLMAPTLRAAMHMFQRFRPLVSDQLYTGLVDQGETTLMQLGHPADVLDQGAASEMALIVVIRVLRSVMGLDDAVLELHFGHEPRGADPDRVLRRFERAVGVPVRFGQDSNGLLLRTESMDRPMNLSGGRMLAAAEQRLVAAVQDIDPTWRESTLRDTATLNVARGLTQPSDLAQALCMSLRAAQRRAAAQGVTIRSLIDDARRSRAELLLLDPARSLDHIADDLGYSSARAFRRAFVRMTGLTPSAYRAAHRR